MRVKNARHRRGVGGQTNDRLAALSATNVRRGYSADGFSMSRHKQALAFAALRHQPRPQFGEDMGLVLARAIGDRAAGQSAEYEQHLGEAGADRLQHALGGGAHRRRAA